MTRKNAAHDVTDAVVEPAIRKTGEIMAASKNAEALPKPTIGRMVHYALTEADAAQADAMAGRRDALPAGKIASAIVTDVHGDECVDLRILVGRHDLFHTSVMRGGANGMWRWPERV